MSPAKINIYCFCRIFSFVLSTSEKKTTTLVDVIKLSFFFSGGGKSRKYNFPPGEKAKVGRFECNSQLWSKVLHKNSLLHCIFTRQIHLKKLISISYFWGNLDFPQKSFITSTPMPASTHPLVADTLPRHSFYLTPGNPSLGHIMAPNDFHQLFFPSDNKHDRLRG